MEKSPKSLCLQSLMSEKVEEELEHYPPQSYPQQWPCPANKGHITCMFQRRKWRVLPWFESEPLLLYTSFWKDDELPASLLCRPWLCSAPGHTGVLRWSCPDTLLWVCHMSVPIQILSLQRMLKLIKVQEPVCPLVFTQSKQQYRQHLLGLRSNFPGLMNFIHSKVETPVLWRVFLKL